MTSFAFILGVLPLVFASGAGALGRQSVGSTIVGGMVLSTVLNLIFIPVLYVILSGVLRRGNTATPRETINVDLGLPVEAHSAD
jgi:HAE1 family hydrophobic/amphiphilic exporter-1